MNSVDPRTLAAALGGEAHGNRVLAPGPGHSPQDRSLSVLCNGDDFVVHSFAGDDPLECRDYVRGKAGLPKWEPTAKREQPGTAFSFRFIEEYIYTDPEGNPSRKIIRLEAPADPGKKKRKSFPQYRWTGSEWQKGASGLPLYPYRLAEMLVAANNTVFVCEGEKDADRIASLGIVATTNPMGAGSWHSDLNHWFRGKECLILADNDEIGRKHAADVARHLKPVAESVRVVELPGLPAKGDVSDWLDVDPTNAERLLAVAKSVPIWTAKDSAADAPLPLFPPLPKSEPYPVANLGPVLSRAAVAIGRKVQVPESIAAQSVLASAALTAQAIADVRLPYGQTRPLSLYLVTVAASGDRKSTADNEALWPLRKREKDLKEIYEADLKLWNVEVGAHGAEKRKIEANKKLSLSERKDALQDLGSEPERPLYPFLTAPDPTVEGLLKAWVNAPASLGIFTAEGGQFTGGHGMGAENRLKSAAIFSEIWDGHPVKRIRAGDGVSMLYGRRLSLHLMVQPDAAVGFLGDRLLRDQGLLSRVLVAAPESIAGTRLYRNVQPEDDAAIRAYGARLLSILESEWPLEEGKRNELSPRVLTMSSAATAAWTMFFDHVEKQTGRGSGLNPIADFAAKAAEHAARIAGVLTIIDDCQAEVIEQAAMADALALVDWYVAESLRLQQAARTDPNLLQAQALLDWIRSHDEGQIDFRDILRLGPAQTRTKAAAEKAVDTLLAHGWLREVAKRPRSLALVEGDDER